MSSSSSSPRSARLLASTRRPSISISPNTRTSRTWASSSCVDGAAKSTVPTAGSALVPVGARADVPTRVQGPATDRAGWPPRGDDFGASTCEGTSWGRLDHDPQHRFEGPGLLGLQRGLPLVIDQDLRLTVMALHDDDPTLGVPPQAHRADPELVLYGCGQRVDVLEGLGDDIRRLTSGEVVEQVVDPVGERTQLLLLQRHGSQPGPGTGLQEEGPLSRRPDSARDEPIWWVELKDRHIDNLVGATSAPTHRRVARRRHEGAQIGAAIIE